MIRDLRKKFILVAMLSTMLVLTAIMGVVNFSITEKCWTVQMK